MKNAEIYYTKNMFIQVRLLKGFSEPLLYCVPEDLKAQIRCGAFVQVPIRNQVSVGIIERIFVQKPVTSFAIKSMYSFETIPQDAHYDAFIAQVAAYYQIDRFYLLKRIRQFLVTQEAKELLEPLQSAVMQKKIVMLTDEQQKVCDFLSDRIKNSSFTPTLLHGVTGSGKTEVYKSLIETVVKEDKTVLLLLPEVTLAVQFMVLLQQQLNPEIPILAFHSATNQKDKKKVWQLLLAKKPCLIIGVHLPILLPIANLGLIIIDEEHDAGYQEKKHPKINSKEVALFRAQQAQIPILLGSATPSLSSLYNVKEKGWYFFQLKKRFSGAFPQVKLIHLNDKTKKKRSFWISKELEAAIYERLAKKEQTILFLNRRGFSFFMQCKACSFIFSCKHCSVSLTLHEDYRLTCHYCGFSMQQPMSCFGCKADEKQLLKKGIGTQQLVSVLQNLFPQARIARADMDTTTNKKIWQQTMQAMHQGTIDILVGTQTVTKGYHFPRVTLVGVIWADLAIHFPMYNASETALQQLIQVAGRAGRDHATSVVIVQTMVDHPIFEFLHEINYLAYYEQELVMRKQLHYPPIIRLVEFELKHTDETVIDREALLVAKTIQRIIQQHCCNVTMLGPAKPPVHKVKNWYSRKLYLKGQHLQEMQLLFQALDKNHYQSSIFFTPNPLN